MIRIENIVPDESYIGKRLLVKGENIITNVNYIYKEIMDSLKSEVEGEGFIGLWVIVIVDNGDTFRLKAPYYWWCDNCDNGGPDECELCKYARWDEIKEDVTDMLEFFREDCGIDLNNDILFSKIECAVIPDGEF